MAAPICVPINLDAFVLNKPVVDTTGKTVLIAPITQPDYVGLRLDNSVIQHDVLPPVDLHTSRPASVNPRISQAYSADLNPVVIKDPKPDFAKSGDAVIQSRLGVYLHWSLPRGYRTGSSGADGAQRTDPDDKSAIPPNSNPTFRLVPNRWLIVRVLKNQHLPPEANPPPIDAWVIESDRLQKVEELPGDIDLETEVTPFLAYDSNPDVTISGNLLHSQAEKYIGYKSKSLATTQYSETTANRVPLSVMNSSNPVFADYTIHNPNVFSMKDNFEYEPGKYLQQATCDYIVVGWHDSAENSPFGAKGLKGTLSARVENFFCKLPDGTDQPTQDLKEKVPLLSHGVIYNVIYDANVRPTTDADKYAENFDPKGSTAMEPVAVGVTPLDSVITFLHAHRDDKTDAQNILGGIPIDAAKNLLDMAELLHATSDDYDSRIKAHDLISGQSFRTALGGFSWHYDKKKTPNSPPQSPDTITKDGDGKTELDYLNKLNRLQQQLDITDRMLALKNWELFAEFFKYCSDVKNGENSSQYFDKMRMLLGAEKVADSKGIKHDGDTSVIQSLLNTKSRLETAIKVIVPDKPATPKIPVKKVAGDAFKQRTDPTLLLAGIDSGWPASFLDYLQIRFAGDVKAPSNPQITQILNNLNLPTTSGTIKGTIEKLLNEAKVGAGGSRIGFKNWTGQPFCPIFVEWEAMFYNVDASQWAVALGNSPMSNNNQPQIRYINPDPLHEPSKLSDQDSRAVSGRILVLPQPSFALAAIVKQVLDVAGVNVPQGLQQEVTAPDGTKKLNGKLDKTKLQDFVKKVEGLKLISGDLMGFTDGLLTLGTGSHVKPNVRQQGEGIKVLGEAKDIITKIGFPADLAEQMILQMGSETARTPYGTLEDFEGASFQPFKGVQHGQLAITKITIVDKFGQAISWPLPERKPRIPPDTPKFAIHPCIADQLCPTVLSDNTLNTVFKTVETTEKPTSSGMVLSPFIQITPAINQASRINASFLRKDFDQSGKLASPPWTTCNDWDNPIFGWIVVNYPDSSLQFFTGDGIFYTALTFGGPFGTVTSLQWAPFASPPPDQASKLVSKQLVDLIAEMKGDPNNPTKTAQAQAYLRAMWGMINGAIGNMPFPPSQYSAYANAIVGKPLALVNVGWSLELAEPPMKAQHTLGAQPKEGYEEDLMSQYQFPVKIGDKERPFDGVVCYWDTDDNKYTAPASTATTDFSTIYTYPYPETSADSTTDAKDPRKMIEPDTFPTLTPYFIDPTKVDDTRGLLKEKASKFLVKTLLTDPYTPLHLYTGILPIKTLQLLGWSLEAAMKNMTAFFTLGPILVTKDVPKEYNDKAPLHADSWVQKQDSNAMTDPSKKEDAFPIKLPIAGGKGMWNWLQPYVDSNATPPGQDIRPLYNALEVGQETGSLRDDPAPYTLLEGFLQLARPLIDASQAGV